MGRNVDWKLDNAKRRAYKTEWARQHKESGKRWQTTHRQSDAQYTDDWEHVEGYDRLKADGRDQFTMGYHKWVVHHRFEDMGLSRADLIEMGLYLNRPACELVIMTNSEHWTHHHKVRRNAR